MDGDGHSAFRRAIFDFTEFLAYRGRSDRTIYGYRSDLTRLEAWLSRLEGGFPPSAGIDRPLLQRYLQDLKAADYAPRTIGRHAASIRSFFTFLLRNRRHLNDPSSGLVTPRVPFRLPRYLEIDLARRLLAMPDVSTWTGARDRAVLGVLFYGGLRVAEVMGLDLDDYRLAGDRSTLRVIGKGDRERIVPVNEPLMESIDRWLSMRPLAESQALFIGLTRARWTTEGIRRAVKGYGAKMGIQVTPHVLRHSFATALHFADVDVIKIQNLLGHASLASTQIYTHTSSRRLHDAVARLA